MARFFTTSLYTIAFTAFLLLMLPASAFAQSAEFQWVPTNSGIQVNADEEAGAYSYNLQLYNQNDEIVVNETNDSGNFFIQNSNVNAGEVHNLSLLLRDESSEEVVATHEEGVAVPAITVDSICEADFRGGTVKYTVNMTPEMSFFSNLSDPEVTPYESGSRRNPVPGLPYVHDQAQPDWTYRFEISFSGSDLVLDSGDVAESCDEDEEEEEEVVNFGYEVNGREVTATVLNPNSDYEYVWDVGGEAGPDYQGTTVSHTFTTDGSVSIELIASQGDDIPGRISHDFVVPANFQDSDGDGTPDAEEGEDDGISDRDNDGIPDGEDECPDDSTNTCNEPDEFEGAPEGGLVNCTNDCGWEEFIDLIDILIKWLVGFATVIATLLFMYAGFLYLTAGGNEGQTDQAKGILTNTAVGFAIILIAWLIVSTVVTLITTEEWRNDSEELLPIEFSYDIDKDTLQL